MFYKGYNWFTRQSETCKHETCKPAKLANQKLKVLCAP